MIFTFHDLESEYLYPKTVKGMGPRPIRISPNSSLFDHYTDLLVSNFSFGLKLC